MTKPIDLFKAPIDDQAIERLARSRRWSTEKTIEEIARTALGHFSSRLLPNLQISSRFLVQKIARLEQQYATIRNGTNLRKLAEINAYYETFPAGGENSHNDLVDRDKRLALYVDDGVVTFPSQFRKIITGYRFEEVAVSEAEKIYRILSSDALEESPLPKFYCKYTALYRDGNPVPWMMLAREWAHHSGHSRRIQALEENLEWKNLFEPMKARPGSKQEVSFQEYTIRETISEFEKQIDCKLSDRSKETFFKAMQNENLRHNLVFFLGHLEDLLQKSPCLQDNPARSWIIALRRARIFSLNYGTNRELHTTVLDWIIDCPAEYLVKALDEPQSILAEPSPRGLPSGARLSLDVTAAIHQANNFRNELIEDDFRKNVLCLFFAIQRHGANKLSVLFEELRHKLLGPYCQLPSAWLLEFIEQAKGDKLDLLGKRADSLRKLLKRVGCKEEPTEQFLPFLEKPVEGWVYDRVKDVLTSSTRPVTNVDQVIELLEETSQNDAAK